ncbi:MAG: molecular chaperone SurA, partial [Gammaproteobacteria bacterium]|nr:molecular chaperone SurA [Gammaproteobacteria bacterium]
GVILQSELDSKVRSVRRGLDQSNTPTPPSAVLRRQVLERMIMEKIQLQLAEKSGIGVDDETLRTAVQQIAQRNQISADELRDSLEQEGIPYTDFLNQIRSEITLGRFRSNQVNSQIKVTDREVDHYLETQAQSGVSGDNEYLLGHILIATPQAASPEDVQKAKEKADGLAAELGKGADFKQAAMENSNDPQALNGGDLGWRKMAQVPTLFAEVVPKMKKGDVQGPIRSPNGFHIIKLLDIKGSEQRTVTKTRVRHILIKPNEALSDSDAEQKLLALKERLANGEDFADLARAHSDDKGSAIKGGELGEVEPGALVPPFEEAMTKLKPNELSEPVQTQFGWHLIQVIDRRESSDNNEAQRNQARDAIFKRKVEEETELWMRRIRDEAYVEIRLPEAEPESLLPPP